MKTLHKLLTATILAGSCLTASAQALHSGYFLEGYTFRHQLNPAFSAERNYVSVPVLGNINVGTQGNVGVGKFLFPRNGELVTFMHSSVSGSKFLDGLRETNRLNADINLAILSAGFKAWGGYNTIGINLRSNTNMTLPRDLFAFMKMGMSKSETHYHMDNLGIQSNNYFEIALGHSRKINDKLDAGAKLKFLLGAANLSMKMNNMDVTLSENKWMIRADGEMNTSLKGLTMPPRPRAARKSKNPARPT